MGALAPDHAALLAGRLAATLAGRHGSGCVPYGYRRPQREDWSDYAPLIEPDPVEAPVVRLIFRLYNTLRSLEKVCNALAERGIRPRRAKAWSRAGLNVILRNDVYIGRVHLRETNVKGLHRQLVSPRVYRRAQMRLIRNNKLRGATEARAQRFAERFALEGGLS